MKTDRIFYRIFKELPQTLFELWGESVELVNHYRFDAVEKITNNSLLIKKKVFSLKKLLIFYN